MRWKWLAVVIMGMLAFNVAASGTTSPYGTASTKTRSMPVLNTVFDVSYDDPKKLELLYDFVRNTRRVTRGKVVIVTHGPELKAFAKENYKEFRGIVDKMADLANTGVKFYMCRNAMKMAGYRPEDMHGFITVVPFGFAEIAYLEYQGYQYINPTPLSTKDIGKTK
ncbi:DsrE family protein [Thiobacillus sp.]|uniref:DsrE family protein n=1 Tax=Thiobacillus sp. TaxID=924 RepID=UPI0025EB12D2|nr:DsrE family protein [Thiobacillus sp.]